MTPKHYYNYRRKYGERAADKRQRIDDDCERQRRDREDMRNRENAGLRLFSDGWGIE